MRKQKIKKIGLVVKKNQTKAHDLILDLCSWLKNKGLQVFVETNTANIIGKTEHYSKAELPELVDLLIVMGGDGTLLSVARRIKDTKVPILGINLGRLGFLTAVTLENRYSAIEAVLAGDYCIEERMMLFVKTIRDRHVIDEHIVLNDVVINRGELARIINVKIKINGHHAVNYRSDGLIIATPTGSTAYSLAAGGPIVYPTIDAIILSPICPHTLTNRHIVIPSDSKIEVSLDTKSEHVILTIDGQEGLSLKHKDKICVERGEHRARLIQFKGSNHYHLLGKKLKWGR